MFAPTKPEFGYPTPQPAVFSLFCLGTQGGVVLNVCPSFSFLEIKQCNRYFLPKFR
jgi:hypothetical protein